MTPYAYTSRRYRQKGDEQSSRGFSLIELLVSVTLFTVVMTVSVGTLLALISANQKAQSLKSVINNLTFAIESMSRTIRTGHTYYCIPDGRAITFPLPTGTNDCGGSFNALALTDDHGVRLVYRRNSTDKSIERRKNTEAVWTRLTAPEVVIDVMHFYVSGASPTDNRQPTATIDISGHAGARASTESSFDVETTVTQRVLD